MSSKLHQLFSFVVLSSLALVGCVPYQSTVYFQKKEAEDKKEFRQEFIALPQFEYKIQPTDIVHIDVVTLDMETVEVFGMRQQNMNAVQQAGFANSPVFYLTGYVIDAEGYISLPVIGNVKLADLSVEAAQKAIQTEIDRYFKDATVTLKLVSYRVTVLGEVTAQGPKIFYNDRVTIFDVLGQAGGATEFADLSKVRIYRPTKEGHEVLYVDLTDDEIMSTENFFLLPNDVVYIEPLRAKSQRFNLSMVGIVTSVVSATALIINLIVSLNN